VTEFEVKLHPLTSVVLAEGLTPESGIRGLLETWRDFMAEAPIDLKWNIDLRLARHTNNNNKVFFSYKKISNKNSLVLTFNQIKSAF